VKTTDSQRPFLIPLAGVCLAGILVSASYWLSHTLTNRFVGFRDDYTLQQAFSAVREIFQFDLGMIRFARSVPMREESRRFFETKDKAELDPVLDLVSANSYRFDFAMVFENGSEFSVGYHFSDQIRAEISSDDPFVSSISAALGEREINRPTGFIASYDKRLCFLYACPFRSREFGARGLRQNGFVTGRWIGNDVALSENYPEFTVRFVLADDFEWPSDLEEFDFASVLRESNSLRLPPELKGGGPDEGFGPGPGRGGRSRGGLRGVGGARGEPPFPRFIESLLLEQEEIPSGILGEARFFQSTKAHVDRNGELRTLLCARIGEVIPNQEVVVQMLLPRNLANAVTDSIRLVQWTSAGIAFLICLFTYAVVREIHRRKVAEVELVISNDELRDANNKKDRLLSIIAHDLRAPLSGVVNLAGLMLKAPESFTAKEIKEFALDIQGTSKRLTELLENLLNWARLQIGKLPYVPVAIDVSMMVHQVVMLFDSTARQKKIELGLEVTDGLRIIGDQEMLRTILRNLIGNAVQYTPENGLVVVSVEQTGGYVAIRVKDSGPGLSPERVESLFELPSQPMLNDGDGSRGAGFGLVLCRELVERLEGHLAVDSKENEGTVFTVCIPERLDFGATERLTRV
jgi:signal transduction histidine kinase